MDLEAQIKDLQRRFRVQEFTPFRLQATSTFYQDRMSVVYKLLTEENPRKHRIIARFPHVPENYCSYVKPLVKIDGKFQALDIDKQEGDALPHQIRPALAKEVEEMLSEGQNAAIIRGVSALNTYTQVRQGPSTKNPSRLEREHELSLRENPACIEEIPDTYFFIAGLLAPYERWVQTHKKMQGKKKKIKNATPPHKI